MTQTTRAGGDLEVGDTREQVVVDDLRRTQIVQYAGASGDFNPLHTDEVYAVEVAGQPGVIAHGMLTMGLSARVVTDWFGPQSLLRLGVRFRKPVRPGDTLTTTAVVTALADDPEPGRPDGRTADLALSTTNQDGAHVLTGTASVRLARGTGSP